MLHRLLADGAMATHFGYLVYLVVGGFLAWRWPRAIFPHLVAVAWALGIVLIGFPCPLTGIERRLRSLMSPFAFATAKIAVKLLGRVRSLWRSGR